MPYSVFLSSTQTDLKPFREAVSRALKEDGYEVIEMERFGARSEVPLDFCLQKVVDAEIFVGIYARRYGFKPSRSRLSITELEYREAKRLGRQCYCYILCEDCPWPEQYCERQAAAELKRFTNQIRDDVIVELFRTPEELADKVRTKLRVEKPRPVEPSRERREVIDLVETMCVRDWLHKNVSERTRLRVQRENCPAEVGKQESEASDEEVELLLPEVVEPIYDTFRAQGCSLLILGAPGAGKTITLLELCHSLLKQARRDPTSRIPMVFNLGSWRWHHLSFATWLKRELDKKYQLGESTAASLIEDDRVVPLLHGLDEVDADAQSACTDAIHAYLKKQRVPIAVCCHSQAYKDFPTLLHLYGAVALRPLTRKQIKERLAAAEDPGLAALEEVIDADEKLQRLAGTPLMLVLLERTYRGADPATIREILRNPAENRRKKVFDRYVTRMLEPELNLPWARIEKDRGLRSWLSRLAKTRRYPPEETRRRLGWLAGRMRQHDCEFLIEQIQPAWLPTAGHRWAYAVLSRAVAGVLLMAPLAFFLESEILLGFGLLAGILAGVMDAPRLRRSSAVGQEDRTLAQSLLRSLLHILLLGGGVFLLYLVAGWIWQGFDLLRGGAILGTLFGLALGTRSAGRDGSNDIHIGVRLKVGRWSSRGTLWGAVSLLLLSLVFWAFSLLRPDLLPMPVFWAVVVVVATVLGGFGGGALGALEDTPVPRSTSPNRGIRWTFLNAGLVALSVMVVLGLCLGALLAVLGRLEVPIRSRDWLTVLKAAMATGFWAGLWFNGLDFVQHYTLRLLLRAAGLLPLRLTHFLSYLTGRGLMQSTGGRYSFESQLLDHFASLPD
ncbi:MAG: hypothetical protein QOH06_2221 [Acidobacteriota bacterium]|jgi:hypothetical protein|nr:hypothetical protein [Acidobacteriota bacterium]